MQLAGTDLSKLPVERKMAIVGASNELLRRKRQERARYFVPVKPSDPNHFGGESNDQLGFMHSTADERWAFGGNRSGKTEVVVNDCDMFCRGIHPVRSLHRKPPVKVRYTAPKWRDGILNVVLRKFQEIVIRSELQGGSWAKAWSEKEHALHYKNGSTVHFKSGEEDLDTFGGTDLDAAYQDERLDRARFQENKMRLADRNGFFAGAMTPEAGITWEQDHVMDPADGITIDYWFFSSLANPHLNKEGVEKVKASIKDPKLAEAKLYGRFVPLQGLVLPQWDDAIHIVPDRKLHPDAYRTFCIDAHTRTPSAAMWAAWEPPQHDKPYSVLVVYRCIKAFLSVPEWQKRINLESQGEKIQRWLGDEPGCGAGKDINGAESIVYQFKQGPDALPMVQVPKPAGSFEGDVYRLWEMLTPDPVHHGARVEVFESCNYPVEYINGKYHGSLPWEAKRWQYKKEQKADEETLREKVVSVNDHYISDLRYLSRYEPSYGQAEVASGIGGEW